MSCPFSDLLKVNHFLRVEWVEPHHKKPKHLPSLQQSWKLTGGFWKTIFLLGNPFVHFHDCWKEGKEPSCWEPRKQLGTFCLSFASFVSAFA